MHMCFNPILSDKPAGGSKMSLKCCKHKGSRKQQHSQERLARWSPEAEHISLGQILRIAKLGQQSVTPRRMDQQDQGTKSWDTVFQNARASVCRASFFQADELQTSHGEQTCFHLSSEGACMHDLRLLTYLTKLYICSFCLV